MSVIIGLDLSLTGTGCIKLQDGRVISQQLIKTKPTGDNYMNGLLRLLEIRDKINIAEVDIAVIEGMAFMARNTTALVQLAALNYFIREKLYLNKIPFIIVAPTSLKKFITSHGNAKKDVMMMETYKRYHVTFSDNNLCDAYGLARIGESLLNKEVVITKIQQEVINLLTKQIVWNHQK